MVNYLGIIGTLNVAQMQRVLLYVFRPAEGGGVRRHPARKLMKEGDFHQFWSRVSKKLMLYWNIWGSSGPFLGRKV